VRTATNTETGTVQCGGVEQRDPPADDAVAFEPLDPAPARRRRQADALGDLRTGVMASTCRIASIARSRSSRSACFFMWSY